MPSEGTSTGARNSTRRRRVYSTSRQRPPVCLLLPAFLAPQQHYSKLQPCTSPSFSVPHLLTSANNGDAAARATIPHADGLAVLPRVELLLASVVALVGPTGLHVPPPASPPRRCTRSVRAPAPPPPRHSCLHRPRLHAPLRARPEPAAHTPAARGTRVQPGVVADLRSGPGTGARARRGVQAPRVLPQVRPRPGPRGAPARRQLARRGRRREPRGARGRVRERAAAAGARRGGRRALVARDGAGRARGGALVEEVGQFGGVVDGGRRRVRRRARGGEAGRRAAVDRDEDGRVRRGTRRRGAVRRRGEAGVPRDGCRAHAPGLVAPASCVPVQVRQLERVRAEHRGKGGRQGRGRRAEDGDAAVVAAAALPRQQRHGRAGAEQPGAVGDGGRAGGSDRQAQLGAAGGDPGALAAPLRLMPGHRLAQPGDLLHALVHQVASAARTVRFISRIMCMLCVRQYAAKCEPCI